MLQSVVVGIDNTRSTFLAAYTYITSESAVSFIQISEQLTDLCFEYCLEPNLICSDFSKGLGATVAAKATADLAREPATDKVLPLEDPKAILEATKVVVGQTKGHPQAVKLQLCKQYTVEAIKQKLVTVRRYKKKERKEIINMIQAWVKALNIEDLEKRCKELTKALYIKEQEYLYKNYQPKEPQFCCVYTQALRNLGVHSTQQNKGYHPILKAKLYKNLPISTAVDIIIDQTANLSCKYNAKINQDRRSLLQLLDRKAFAVVSNKLIHYTLEKASQEWSETKKLTDIIEQDELYADDLFEPSTEYRLGCELPICFALLCKHQLYKAYQDDVPIPLSLFHPHWFLDSPAILHKRWVMSWDPASEPQPAPSTSI